MNAQHLRHSHYSSPVNGASNNESIFQWPPTSSTIAYNCISVLLGYYLLIYFDLLPCTFTQAIWRTIVHLTPSRVIFALDKADGGAEVAESHSTALNVTKYQAKSQAMERILGLDSASFFATFPRARSLSGLGNLLGSRDNPPGLGNWDNSCYQNSIIQGLASLQSLNTFLENNIAELGEKGVLSTHAALKGIIAELNDPANSGQKLWTPGDLKSMSSWQQQDAQEYFSKVVEQLDREVQRASKGKTSDLGLKAFESREDAIRMSLESNSSKGSASESDTDRTRRSNTTASNTPVRNPLEGLLAQRVGCMRCGWAEGLSLIPFNCLTVPLGGGWEYDVRDCLDDYTSLEPIEGVECAKCTLLRNKDQLERLLTQIASDAQVETENGPPGLSEALKNSAESRLKAVQEALEEEAFSEETLSKKCHIPSRSRVTSTKSRQAIIARAPQSLVIHVNRSVFNEMTGAQTKNPAEVKFPKILNLDEWCLGAKSSYRDGNASELWGIDPSESMLPNPGASVEHLGRHYELKALITHYGRHENGHYICYRKYPTDLFPETSPGAIPESEDSKEPTERWFRLSDDDVAVMNEEDVMKQGGVFMLFYEAIEPLDPVAFASEPAETASSVHASNYSAEVSEATVDTAETSMDEATDNGFDEAEVEKPAASVSSSSSTTEEQSDLGSEYLDRQPSNGVTPVMRTSTSTDNHQNSHNVRDVTSPSLVRAL
ncbi:hypothetical protein FQN54_006896 [Arachnomyces sp. PD_36]|nr:hypothetical protein FQN54_006896 [Arachnomyces sp. PD_36]